MIELDGLKVEILSLTYGDVCNYEIKLSYKGFDIVIDWQTATDKISLRGFLREWFTLVLDQNSDEHCDAMCLFGSIEEIEKYAERVKNRA